MFSGVTEITMPNHNHDNMFNLSHVYWNIYILLLYIITEQEKKSQKVQKSPKNSKVSHKKSEKVEKTPKKSKKVFRKKVLKTHAPRLFMTFPHEFFWIFLDFFGFLKTFLYFFRVFKTFSDFCKKRRAEKKVCSRKNKKSHQNSQKVSKSHKKSSKLSKTPKKK